MFKAVIFDVDGTLTTSPLRNAWVDLTDQLGGDPQEHRRIFKTFFEGGMSLEEAKKRLVKLWNACDISEEKTKKIYEGIPLRDGAEEVTEYLNNKNYTLCIITGSPNLFAKTTAERLNIPYYYGRTEFVWENDKLVDFEYEPEGDKLKLEQLKDFVQKQKLELDECVVVGDGWNDNKLFTATGNGIAIKSDEFNEELKAIAWKTIEELPELKDIL